MRVYFVGAGPGDPELLTRKAERLLRTTHFCIYVGSLVSPGVLELLPEDAERYDSARLDLQAVLELILGARSRDLDVVRLHTGDPSIYGAIGEQMTELDRRGIDHEVVPGVRSFQAAAAALRWELTVPEITQSIVLTRTPGRTPMPAEETLERFASTGATLCLFLSVHAIEEHARTLAEHYGADCPVAVVFRASWPDQQIVHGTLGDIAAKVSAAGMRKTAMIIVRRVPKGAPTHSRLYDPGFAHSYRSGH